MAVQILGFDAASISVEFCVMPADSLALPARVEAVRADDLWQATCFEVFLRSTGSAGYVEMNFSPSSAWAAYTFEGYRDGMAPFPMRLDPEIGITGPETAEGIGSYYFLAAEFDVPLHMSEPIALGLSAIIEEVDGTRSYWALAHPPGDPDFHHPDSFALKRPAAPSSSPRA